MFCEGAYAIKVFVASLYLLHNIKCIQAKIDSAHMAPNSGELKKLQDFTGQFNLFPEEGKQQRTRRETYKNPYAGVDLQEEAIKIRTKFIEDLRHGPMDLVILVERSRPVGRFFFNGYVKNMLNYTLRYNTDVRPQAVRVAIASFAKSIKVHVNGLSEDLSKCQLWHDKAYLETLLFDGSEGDWEHGDFGEAYQTALEIFSKAENRTGSRYLWVISSGEVLVQNGDPDGAKEQLLNLQVTIVGVITGISQQAHIASFRNILSSTDHLLGNVTQFAVALPRSTPLEFTPSDLSDECGTSYDQDCYYDTVFGYKVCGIPTCMSTCKLGDRCVKRTLTGMKMCGELYLHTTCKYENLQYRVCTCHWLSSDRGPDCLYKEEDCVDYACANGGTCTVAGDNSYNCSCPRNFTGQYCEYPGLNPAEEKKKLDEKVIAAAAGGGAALLVVVGVGCCICWRKRRRRRTVETAEIGTDPAPTTCNMSTSTEPIPEESLAWRFYNTMRGLPMAIIKPKKTAPPVPPKPPPKPKPLRPVGLDHIVGSVTSIATNNSDDDDESINTYLNTPLCDGMEEWESYILELTVPAESTLYEVCIVEVKKRKYVSSSMRILPTGPELASYLSTLRSRVVGGTVNVKRSEFSVTENNGKMMKTFERGGYHGIMCIAKSARYVVIGYTRKRSREKQCAVEVDFLRNHLVNEGL